MSMGATSELAMVSLRDTTSVQGDITGFIMEKYIWILFHVHSGQECVSRVFSYFGVYGVLGPLARGYSGSHGRIHSTERWSNSDIHAGAGYSRDGYVFQSSREFRVCPRVRVYCVALRFSSIARMLPGRDVNDLWRFRADVVFKSRQNVSCRIQGILWYPTVLWAK